MLCPGFPRNVLRQLQPGQFSSARGAWRLRRVFANEAGFYEMKQSTHPNPSPAGRLALAHFQCSKQLDALSRHEEGVRG